MQNLLKTLEQILHKDDRLVIDNLLAKNKIMELALAMDASLLKLLISDESLKNHFFKMVEETLIFDKQEFIRFVNNKNFLPDSYTSFKNKIGLMDEDGTYMSQSKDVVLAFPYKDCILEGGQNKEDAKRKEIFWNTTLAPTEIDRLLDPKVFTNFKKYDKDGEKEINKENVNFDKENLIIKGNNLLALHSLERLYRGKVKLIYIDPPYNTGGSGDTFVYNNSFKRSSWLTFMKNRLEVAKSLLREDGVIIAAIDDFEHHTLRLLMDEIFIDDNRLGTVVVVHNPRGRNDDKYFATMHEYLLVYAKNKDLVELKNFEFTEEDLKQFNKKDDISDYAETSFMRTGNNSNKFERPNLFYPIYFDSKTETLSLEEKDDFIKILPINANGEEKTWRWGKETFEEKQKSELFVKKIKGEYRVFKKRRASDVEGRKPRTVWNDSKYDASSNGIMLLKNLMGKNVFSYPKSLYAVMDIIKILSEKDDTILDFFAGSGTTAHAVLELNKDGGKRKFIMIEQMDYIETVTVPRIVEVMKRDGLDSNFIFLELLKLNQNFIDEIQSAKSTQELLRVWEGMQKQGFLSYRLDAKALDDNAEKFRKMTLDEQKNILISVLDHNHLYVNYSEMNDVDHAVSDKDKILNTSFYSSHE